MRHRRLAGRDIFRAEGVKNFVVLLNGAGEHRILQRPGFRPLDRRASQFLVTNRSVTSNAFQGVGTVVIRPGLVREKDHVLGLFLSVKPDSMIPVRDPNF